MLVRAARRRVRPARWGCRSASSGSQAAFPPEPTWSLADIVTRKTAFELSDAELKRVAELAHLHIPAAEAERVRADLSSVLSAARALQSFVPPPRSSAAASTFDEAAATRRVSELRPDAVRSGGDAAAVLAHAAVTEPPYFAVPKVLDAEE